MVKNCGAYKVSVLVAGNYAASAVKNKLCALFNTLVYIGENLLLMLLVCYGAELRIFFPGRAYLDFFSLTF